MPEAKEKNQTNGGNKTKSGDKTPAKKTAVAHKPTAEASAQKGNPTATLIAVVALLVGGGTLIGGYSNLQGLTANISDLSQRTSINEKELAGYSAHADSSLAVADTVQNTNKLLQNRLDTLDSKVDTQVNELSSKLDSQIDKLSSSFDSKVTELQQSNDSLSDSIDSINSTLKTMAGKIKTNLNDRWLVTEASNLITIANQQAQLNSDAKAAISALEAADQRLREAADPTLLAARQALTDDIIALRGVSQLDVTGIALTLSKLENDIAQLPLKNELPETASESVATAPTEENEASDINSFIDRIWGDIKTLVTVRRSFDSTSPALLPPGQKFFLEQNLRLKLQTARLALLQRNNQVFKDSITTSTAWLEQYFDGSSSATANLKSSLAPYSSLELNPALPDISRTLLLLEEWQTQQDNGDANS